MRSIHALCAACLVSMCAMNVHAQPKLPCTKAGDDNSWLGIETIQLWPGKAPEAKGSDCQDIPTLTIFSLFRASGNNPAVIILPGGAYVGLAATLEGCQVADWFTSRGIKAFILQYRLSSHKYLLPVPLLDARRAVQLVRARAAVFQIDPNRIVLVGFSAGGHLAALASVQPIQANPASDDPVERFSSRPNYLVLGYPWIGAISSDTSHLSYCKLFNVMDRCEDLRKAYSPDLFVNKDTPPTFWWHTRDDETVPVEQGLSFFEALVKAGVPAEAHIFAHGHHGMGMGSGDDAVGQWPDLLDAWLRKQGLIAGVTK